MPSPYASSHQVHGGRQVAIGGSGAANARGIRGCEHSAASTPWRRSRARDNITFVPVSNVTAIAKALEEGRIDAGMLSPVASSELSEAHCTQVGPPLGADGLAA